MEFPKHLPGEDFINSWYPILIALVAGFIFGLRYYFKGPPCPSQEDCRGKTVIVTGASSGIGKEAAKEFALRGARVILACKDETKAKEAIEDIKQATRSKKVVVRKLDLASFESIRAFASEVIESEQKIDILFNNAGVICHPFKKSEDGNEYHFQVNYLGHFLLTHLLINKLKESKQGRIINNTALAYRLGSIDFDDINWENKEYKSGEAYSQSKVALVFFTQRLAKELEGTKVTVNCCLPGVVNSDGLQYMPFKQNSFIRVTFAPLIWFLTKSCKDGAQTACYTAIAKEEEGVSGKLFSDCHMIDTDANAINEETQGQLWDLSMKMTGIEKYI